MDHISVLLVLAGLANAPVDVVEAIDRSQLTRDDHLISYSVTEHYSLKNTRFGTAAELVAQATYSRGTGKVYEVISRTGSAMMQSKVLDRLLAEEAEMSKGQTRKNALVTSANYVMKTQGEHVINGRRCILLDLTPRMKSTHLLKGKLWVDAETYNIVRIEGVPAKSPSFWAGSPMISREYADIGEFAYAQKSIAVSGSLLLGKTEMIIEYSNYKIHVEDQ